MVDHITRVHPLGARTDTATFRAFCSCRWKSQRTYTDHQEALRVARGHVIAEQMMAAATCHHREADRG